MYSQTDTHLSTAFIGVLLVLALLTVTAFVGTAGAVAPSDSASSQSLSSGETVQQLDTTQDWCISFMNTNRDTSVLGDLACSATTDISPHQQIQLDYTARNQGPTEYLSLTLNSNASLPAEANVTISKDNEVIASYQNANESLAFVEEQHYNYLTESYASVDETTEDGQFRIPTSDRRDLRDSYTENELQTLLDANLTEDEVRNLRLYEMTLNAGAMNSITVSENYTSSDFTSSVQDFEYDVTIQIKSRGSLVGGTEFAITRTVSQDVLDEEVPSNPAVSDGGTPSPSSDSQVRQVVNSGFEVVLDDTVTTSISRYTDGTRQISPLQDPSVPPNADNQNSAVGTAENVSNLRENNTRYPAVVYGSGTENRLHFGSAYYGIPEANYHYLTLTYAFQGESADSQAQVHIVDRQGNTLSTESPRYLQQTVNDSIDLNNREQFQQAIEQDTLNTKKVTIRLTEQEVRYINNNYEAYVTYETDGGSDTLLLYDASIVSTDTPKNGSRLPDSANTSNESDFEENPATFDIEYRMSYNQNAEYGQIDILPQENFSIPVTITNRGDTRVERTIGLYDEYSENNMNYSTVVSERTVMVPPQSQKTVILENSWQGYQHGNHTVTIYDTTNESNWQSVDSLEGQSTYSVYVLQPPTFEIVGISAPESWLRYDHFQTLVAVQNVGDLDTDFYQQSDRPYVQGKFGPWQGRTTKFIGGGDVRAGEPGGTVNMYFKRNNDYSPDFPYPDKYYANDTWRNNAPYHTNISAAENNTTGEKNGPFELTFESVHPWAVIQGQNTVTDTPHQNYVTYENLQYPQLNESSGEVVYENYSPTSGTPFINYYDNTEPQQSDRFVYQNELRNCHLRGNHTKYAENISDNVNESQVVNNCMGLWQDEVRIYELGISRIRLRNTNNSMVERSFNFSDYSAGWETQGSEPYYASAWPYTETDPSVRDTGPQDGQVSVDGRTFPSDQHYANIAGWEVTDYGNNATLSVSEINSLLEQYETGEITRDEMRRQLLSEQAYYNGEQAFTDRGLERATSCDSSTTSQLDTPGNPPNCAGFGLEERPMPATLIQDTQAPVETTREQVGYVDVIVVNNGSSSAGLARVKIVTNKTGTGIGGTDVVGYASQRIRPESDGVIRVPIVLPNNEGVEGHHDLQVRIRTEPDYMSYRISQLERDQTNARFGVDFYAETWEDFNFKNVSSPGGNSSFNISQRCEGIGVGECDEQGKQLTHFSTWNYENEGGEGGVHEIESTFGFYDTPTDFGWPTQHHKEATQYRDNVTDQDYRWLSGIPGDQEWVADGGGLQKNRLQWYQPNETETWVMQHQVREPGIYRVYVTQERVHNEQTNGTLGEYFNTTDSMWGTNAGGPNSSINEYGNQSHYLTYQVYDIKSPVSRFHYQAEMFPRTHSSTAYDNTTNGDVVVWEGGTLHFDGRERLDWSLSEYQNGIASTDNLSSDNVGVETYEWTFSGGDARIWDQSHDNRGGTQTEGKVSRRFNDSGTYTVELYVEDYPSYTQGAANNNMSEQTVEVKSDTTKPTVNITYDGNNQNYDVNNDVIWSGSPDDRSTEFTTVDFAVHVDDNAIGLECGGTNDVGEPMDHCGWTKDDGTWNNVDHGEVAESATWYSEIHYQTRQNSNECVQYYVTDFNQNENDSERCVEVHEDTTKPDADYYSEESWVWSEYSGTGFPGETVTWNAGNSFDKGDPAVGLHGEAYDHTVDSGWRASETITTTYPAGGTSRTETESVTVRDWYGNQNTTDADVTVRTDHSSPTSSCDSSNCHSEDYADDYSSSYTSDGSASATGSSSASATTCVTFSEQGYDGGVGFRSVDADGASVTTFSNSTVEVCITASASESVTASASASCSVSCSEPSTCGSCDSDSCSASDSDDPSEQTSTDDRSATVTVTDHHGNTETRTISAYAEATADAYAYTSYEDSCEECSASCPTESTNSTAPPTLSLSGVSLDTVDSTPVFDETFDTPDFGSDVKARTAF